MKKNGFVLTLAALLILGLGTACFAANSVTFLGKTTWTGTITDDDDPSSIGETFTVTGGISKAGEEFYLFQGYAMFGSDEFFIISGSGFLMGNTFRFTLGTSESRNDDFRDTGVMHISMDSTSLNGTFYEVGHDFDTSTREFSERFSAGTITLTGSPISYTYYIPYYKAMSDWTYYSSLALRNSSTTDTATVTVAAYENDGTPVALAAAFTNFPIEPSGQWAQVLPAINIEGWVKVTSTQPLSGLAWVGQLDGAWPRLMADVSLIGGLNTTLVVPHVAQTIAGYNPNGGWTTKANICNPNATATNVTLTYYTQAGGSPHTATIPINPNGSVSYNLAGFLPTNQSFENGSVLIEATQPVAAFALYYDVDKVPGEDGTCYAGISAVAP